MIHAHPVIALLPLLLLACASPPGSGPGPQGGDSGTADGGGPGDGGSGAEQDIVTTHLALDLENRTGVATLQVQPAAGASTVLLDVSGLDLRGVTVDGVAVGPEVRDGMLPVPVDPGGAPVQIEVAYDFPARSDVDFDGWMPGLGVSFTWPYFCGNLYPCDPQLRDGVRYTMEVTGAPAGQRAIFPARIPSDAPSYMPAVAVGDYQELALGTTSAGTTLRALYLPTAGGLEGAQAGTELLVDVFDYFERVYGPYSFGADVATVEVDWGADSWGGMEHHPYFHVGRFDFDDGEVHAHEAAHGWFGDGVRIGCWEDFVLSEGTVTYMAARATEQVGGRELWSYYVEGFLIPICEGLDVNTVVLPETCNEIDLLHHDIWSLATYMKGACFYEEVADLVGADLLDEVIAELYQERVGGTARMQDMIDRILARTDPSHHAAIETLAEEWLRTEACPKDYAERCGAH